jgi:serine protease Do
VKIHRSIVVVWLGCLVVAARPPVALSNTAENVSIRAKEVTVTIDAKNNVGSGVIIGRNGMQYSVLTNWHVLREKEGYKVKTKDGQTHTLDPKSIRQIGSLDLAVGTFISAKSYRVVELGNSDNITEGSTLYVTGAPANLRGISTRSLLVVGGQLVGYNANDSSGYNLIYNNNTQPGMSGGSVLDSNGNLVGIHGRGSQDANNIKSGFNLGIPINLFVTNANRLGIRYTAERPSVDRLQPSLVKPTYYQGRPRVVDGSEGANGACAGERC